jgi:type VI secretion system secreted protein VgrG
MAAAARTQTHRHLLCTTPLGKDVLLLTGFEGEEEMSKPYSYSLEFLSAKHDIGGKDLVGKPITWQVQPIGGTPRVYHGIVRNFAAGEVGHVLKMRAYHADVVPWIWFLTQTNDCRIFQNKTAPDIIKQIFDEGGFRDYTPKLQGSYPTLEYCVQYRESDFDFISRLMEEYGIFFYFDHTSDKHMLILGDAKSAFKDCAETQIEFSRASKAMRLVTEWRHEYNFQPGKWAQTDYNFETPSASLVTDAASLVKIGGNDKFEVFDFPGRYGKAGDGKALTKVRMEEMEAAFDTVQGEGTYPAFTPGAKFKMVRHECESEKKGYVITSIRHSALDESYSGDAEAEQMYTNTFTCIPDTVNYRAPRKTPRPVVRGPQTAVVVGPKGEEIYTDKYGRVKVQFFWDRLGKKDENSSCWVRVSQNWAGKNWGIAFHPRIGQEVIVDFLEGDPDRPIITGRVYNAEQMPPYALPANQTQSTIKSRSSKGGGTDDFNELRFEDKKGSEEVYFHAQKDYNQVVENNATLKVGSAQASDGSQTIEIWKDRTEKVKTGNEKVTIEKGNRDVQVDMGNDTHKVKMGNRDVQIDMGNDTLTIKMGNQTTKLNLGASSTEAMQSIELKVGQSSLKVDQMGVTISGMMVKIQGQIQTQVQGTMTQIQGSAMTQISGGITMIG